MNNSKDQFLQRMFLYRLQYLCGFLIVIFIWFGVGKTCRGLLLSNDAFGILWTFGFPAIAFPIFNTITYFYSKYLAKKYGIEMFADLDQEWLREHQAFDSKAFGEIFARLIQCRKIAGPYMLAVIVLLAFVNMYVATGVGAVYIIAYFFYRVTYLDTAISYKVPRAFGGGGVVVSKIIDEEFNSKLDKLSNKIDK
jgi:Zn-dependent protease with chaperone function